MATLPLKQRWEICSERKQCAQCGKKGDSVKDYDHVPERYAYFTFCSDTCHDIYGKFINVDKKFHFYENCPHADVIQNHYTYGCVPPFNCATCNRKGSNMVLLIESDEFSESGEHEKLFFC